MRTLFSLMLLAFSVSLSAQEKNFLDRPYLETSATVDTLVTPDRIYMNIILQESDSRGKKTTEQLEKAMEEELRKLGIDITKDLTLLDFSSNYKRYFLKSQDILKTKVYRLLVRSAVMADKALQGMESMGISNVTIERTEYSRHEQLLLTLKSEAVQKAKTQAEYLTAPVKQKAGAILHISDISAIPAFVSEFPKQIILRGVGSINGDYPSNLPSVEFEKLKYQVQVNVKFALE